MQKNWEKSETLANGYSSESAQRELSNEYQYDRVVMVFKKSLRPCALDESTLSIGRVNSFIHIKGSSRIVIWTFQSFDNNLKTDITKYSEIECVCVLVVIGGTFL